MKLFGYKIKWQEGEVEYKVETNNFKDKLKAKAEAVSIANDLGGGNKFKDWLKGKDIGRFK